jgi:hypothetical protein
MMDAGDAMMPDAGADFQVSCEVIESAETASGGHVDYYGAEFDVDPGHTEVTTCQEGWGAFNDRPFCWRIIAQWYEGTSTGVQTCGARYFGADGSLTTDTTTTIRSITVHN